MSYRISVRFSKIIAMAVVVLVVAQAQAISTAALRQGILSLAPMLERVTPAVVSIRVSKAMPTSGRGSEQMGRPYATGAGSGVIVDAAEGLIITNHHVVDGASRITVRLSDERTLEATLLGSDPGTDVALLQVEAQDLIEIAFADVSTVAVGDYVVAIGNPFGIGQTVTSGIVSALGRAGINNDNYEDFIQTDAAINLGNSGGALVDMEGNLIGINTAIISGSGGSNGIGFAVPTDMVASVMEHLKRDGEVRRGLLGVAIADATPDIVAALEVDVDYGAVVTSVMPNSAAEMAGVQLSDVIVEIDGKEVRGSRQLRNMVGLMRQDQLVELVLYRDGIRESVQARIGGSSGQAIAANSAVDIRNEFRGARLEGVKEDNKYVNQGVEVVSLSQFEDAWAAGLREGDVIVEVNRRSIADLEAFNRATSASAANSRNSISALTVIREGRRILMFL
ncbi:MAG: trypsin-like peptidase domain-containing protein [Proteobacteria bacterium]|jgi:serine protease DegQ|nr:trypsin-like peptidase domain-containing protein [Pseudomonadota bacterium]MDA1290877.1 trypsin-like peptidase domain-containing protein [Pseudomonadota bacterium]